MAVSWCHGFSSNSYSFPGLSFQYSPLGMAVTWLPYRMTEIHSRVPISDHYLAKWHFKGCKPRFRETNLQERRFTSRQKEHYVLPCSILAWKHLLFTFRVFRPGWPTLAYLVLDYLAPDLPRKRNALSCAFVGHRKLLCSPNKLSNRLSDVTLK